MCESDSRKRGEVNYLVSSSPDVIRISKSLDWSGLRPCNFSLDKFASAANTPRNKRQET
jgi:hypothetical protein